MLKNFWYAVEVSTAVTQAPRRVRVMGHDLVLFRSREGQVVALSSLCPHRGGDLAAGAVVEGCIRCPYHGWRFDAHGACRSVPANPPGAPVPKRARIDAYPACERYGLVWLFLGDLPEAERPPIPPLPEFGQPGWKAQYGEFHFRAHYARVVENGLDFAHGPFVHAASFGNINQPEVPEYQVEHEEWGAHAQVTLPAAPARGLWRYLGPKRRPDVPVRLSFFMPNLVRIHLRPRPGWEVIIFDTNIPVDEGHTRTIWLSLRNFLRGDWADPAAARQNLAIFREDQPIVEGVRPVRPPSPAADTGAELLVRSDQLLVAYRRLRRRCFERGWFLDPDAASQPAALPGPSRRDPTLEKSFVIPEAAVLPPGRRDPG
jgi:phenylpropionate dioxygenase-like ring-hydroxylating dioxygenase large terminal subunit